MVEEAGMASSRKTEAAEAVPVIPVAAGEDPWTAEELAEVRAELQDEVTRLQKKVAVAEEELHELLTEGSDVAGRDPADVGSSNFERDQGMSLAAHARELLDQSVQALRLFDAGEYGVCEVCGGPIGKGRLQAFPRATMCVACKQRAERR
jgi:DnaK suppressor protein